MDKSKFIQTIKQEFEMCLKYSHYHSAFYINYSNTAECALKIHFIEDTIQYLINEYDKEDIDIYFRKTSIPYRFNVYFNNKSKFYVVTNYENTRGLRNYHSLVDEDISKEPMRWIRHSTIDAEMYDPVLRKLISKEDRDHFGKVEIVQINSTS